MSEINFFSEDIEFILPEEKKIRLWLLKISLKEEKTLETINFIFCSDPYLQKINKEYLNHDTFTDIITFPYGEDDSLEGDIFISIDRIRENAVKFNISFNEELLRVMSHGIMHLCGYNDKNEKEQAEMRRKEDESLEVWRST